MPDEMTGSAERFQFRKEAPKNRDANAGVPGNAAVAVAGAEEGARRSGASARLQNFPVAVAYFCAGGDAGAGFEAGA